MAVASRKLIVSLGLEGDQLVLKRIKEVDNALDRAGNPGGGASKFAQVKGAMQGIIGPAAEVVSAIKDIGQVAYAVGSQIFEIARNASEFGSQIQDMAEKTGLSAATLSSLRAAAVTTKTDIEALSAGVVKFSKTIYEAGQGSKEAAAKLTRLGLDPKEAMTDLEGSLDKVFKKIYDAKNPIQQTGLALDAFGKSGADLKSIIFETGGSIDEMKRRAAALGVQISTEDARAADAFGDAMAILGEQARGAGLQFALGFMPATTNAMRTTSAAARENQAEFRRWGAGLGLAVQKTVPIVIEGLRAIVSAAVAAANILRRFDFVQKLRIGHDARAELSGWSGEINPLDSFSLPGGGGGGAGAGAGGGADTKYQAAVRAAKNSAESIAESVRFQTATLEREYRLQIASIDQYATAAKALADKKLRAGYDSTNAERAALAATKKTDDEREQIGRDLDQRDIKAKHEHVEALRTIEDRADADRLTQMRNTSQRAEAVQIESDRAQIERAKASAERYAAVHSAATRIMSDADAAAYEDGRHREEITFEETEKIAARLALNAINRKRAQLGKELALAKDNLAERANIQAELDLLDKQERSTKEENSRRIAAGAAQDKRVRDDNFLSAADHTRKLIDLDGQLADSASETERQRLTAVLEGTNAFGRARQVALAKIAVLDVAELTEKHKHNRAALDADESALLIKTTIEEERLEIKRKFNELRAEEDERYDQSVKDRVKQGNDDVNASGNIGAFMSGFDTGRIAELKNGVQSFGDVAATAFSAAGAAAGQFANALVGMYETWILMGDAGPHAMAKMAAGVLASIATQSATLAIFELAKGFAAMFWNPAEAGAHFTAAALFGGLALGTGLAGRAIAGDKFNGKGGGSSAGTAPDYSQFGQQGFAGNQSIRTGAAASPTQGRMEAVLNRVADALTGIEGVKDGESFRRGLAQNRGLIGETIEKELSNQSLATGVGRKLGFAR